MQVEAYFVQYFCTEISCM